MKNLSRKFYEWLRFWSEYLNYKLEVRSLKNKNLLIWQRTFSDLQSCEDKECYFNKEYNCTNLLRYVKKDDWRSNIIACSRGLYRNKTYAERQKETWAGYI